MALFNILKISLALVIKFYILTSQINAKKIVTDDTESPKIIQIMPKQVREAIYLDESSGLTTDFESTLIFDKYETNEPTISETFTTIKTETQSSYTLLPLNNQTCGDWYNKIIKTNISTLLQKAIKSSYYSPCPFTKQQAELNFGFKAVSSDWQVSAACFQTRSPIKSSFLYGVCCYDIQTSAFVSQGENAGFFYDQNYEDVISIGHSCCYNADWSSCAQFYSIYQPSSNKNYQPIVPCSSSGDPHIVSLDNLGYTFNGYGNFIFSKALDNTFEIQGRTALVESTSSNTNVKGTVFIALAMRASESPVIEVRISNYKDLNAQLLLYVNGILWDNFVGNTSFYAEFPSVNATISVTQNADGVLVLMNNGISVQIKMNTLTTNGSAYASWLQTSMSSASNIVDYAGKLVGLMGNYNGVASDDVMSRSGEYASDVTNQTEIYSYLATWRVFSDESLFLAPASDTLIAEQSFIPITNISPDSQTLAACQGYYVCEYDASVTGLLAFGLNSLQFLQTMNEQRTIALNNPPVIKFNYNTYSIDMYSNRPVKIIANISDDSANSSIKISIFIQNTSNLTTNFVNNTSFNDSQSVEIVYYPQIGEIPTISILASDSLGASTTAYVNFNFCYCRNVDSSAQCQFNKPKSALSPYVNTVGCNCSKYYDGDLCTNVFNSCTTLKPCDGLGDKYNITYTCIQYTIAEQKATNMAYYCNGTCTGDLVKNSYGICTISSQKSNLDSDMVFQFIVDINSLYVYPSSSTSCQTKCSHFISTYLLTTVSLVFYSIL